MRRIFVASLSAMASSDLENRETHQPEGIQLEELLSNQKRQLSLASEVKEVERASLPSERRLLARKTLTWSEIRVMPLLYKGSLTSHRSMGTTLFVLHHHVPQTFNCLICSNLFSLRVLFQNHFSKDIRLTCVSLISVGQNRFSPF